MTIYRHTSEVPQINPRIESLAATVKRQIELEQGTGERVPRRKDNMTDDVILKPGKSRVGPESSKSKNLRKKKTSNHLDAVVFMIVLAQLLAIATLVVECYAFSIDFSHWNEFLEGRAEATSSISSFKGKTLNLETHEHLIKAQEYLTRSSAKEILFILLILIILVCTTLHLCGCHLRASSLDDYAVILISLYAISGAVCIASGNLLISSAIHIENSYTYGADMFYNFQHAFDSEEPVRDQASCSSEKFIRGCANYEYARKQAGDLEQILRICGSGSRYTRYYQKSNRDDISVVINGDEYTRAQLKNIGFCSPDGYKYMAAVIATLAGVLFSLVPIIFCCETRSVRSKTLQSNEKLQLKPNVEAKEGKHKLEDQEPMHKHRLEDQEPKHKHKHEVHELKHDHEHKYRHWEEESRQNLEKRKFELLRGWKNFIESETELEVSNNKRASQ